MKKLRLFAASPSDVATERAKVETVAHTLKPLADHLGLVLEVVNWRKVVPDMGRPQQVIFDQLKPTAWDVFIGILWHRFGTAPGGKDPATQKNYLSGAEEEFKTAYRLWQEFRKPRIMMYRCTRPIPTEALDPDQFKRVKDFFEQFEAIKGEHPGLYQAFDTSDAFKELLLDHLQKLLIELGKHLKKPITPEVAKMQVPKSPDNLPRRVAFFGRDQNMSMVLRGLSPEDRTWGVLVDGIGGIGKTALVVEAAYRCKEKALFEAFVFVSAKQNRLTPDGIRKLPPDAATLDEFLNETARVLGETGIPQLASAAKRRKLLEALRLRRTLLLYDNLETLLKAEQEALADFLRELPSGCKAIITSRRRGGEGAVWVRLEKLEWGAGRAIIHAEAQKDVLLANKLQRAGEARWQELYEETKGSPLALVHTLGLLRVRATLTFDSALAMLRGNHEPDLQDFVFQEARKDLTENDQVASRALSFFAPSATFEAWLEVAALSRNALDTTIDRLAALSLVNVLANKDRFALHPLTSNFVRKNLLANEQIAHEVGKRFAEYWMVYAERYGGEDEESYKTYDRLEAEWPNLEATAEWLEQKAAVQNDRIGYNKEAAERLNDLANALRQFLWFAGRWEEGVQLSRRAFKAMRSMNDWRNAGWHAFDVAWIHYNRAETEEAAIWADRCAEAWETGGSKYEQATGMHMLGLVAKQRKDYDVAAKLYQYALAIYCELKDDECVAIALNGLGAVEHARKQYDAAERYYQEALALAEKEDLKEQQAYISGNLGFLALDRKRRAEAREWFKQALLLGKEVGRQDLIAQAQHGLARVYEAEDRLDLALPSAQAALEIYERLRDMDLAETRALVERLTRKLSGKE